MAPGYLGGGLPCSHQPSDASTRLPQILLILVFRNYLYKMETKLQLDITATHKTVNL